MRLASHDASYLLKSLLMFAQAKHRLKPVDKLIGKVEKLTVGEHPSNAYIVVSIGEGFTGPHSGTWSSEDSNTVFI